MDDFEWGSNHLVKAMYCGNPNSINLSFGDAFYTTLKKNDSGDGLLLRTKS